MNALVPIQTSNVEIYRTSTDAADLCKDIVVASAMEIQDRKYVKVEGWQAIAIAHGCTGSARDIERVDGGVRAIGEVRRMSDGAVIATAEGFVGEDEPTWFGGTVRAWKWGERRGEKVWYDKELPKRADYAIRAMAQTRAISRACRSAFAHVVVMMNAGLSTTPAEEVPHGGFDDEREPVPVETVREVPREPTRSQAPTKTTGGDVPQVPTLGQRADKLEKALRSLTTPGELRKAYELASGLLATLDDKDPERLAEINKLYEARFVELSEPKDDFGIGEDEIPY